MRSNTAHDERRLSPADLRLIHEDGTKIQPLQWRAFGDPADLAFNFRSAARESVVTELLARCRSGSDDDLPALRADARLLTLSGRIGGLAAIVARTASRDAIDVELRCPQPDCRATLQVSLSVSALLELSQQAESARAIAVPVTGLGSLQVRRPTGADQYEWRLRQYHSASGAERAMVESLLVPSSPEPTEGLSESAIAAIDAALEEADPLTCFRVYARCPSCDEEDEHTVDLEAILLQRLHQEQRLLLHDIHQLATRYGWSEETIAALPAWRRQAYLGFIEREDA